MTAIAEAKRPDDERKSSFVYPFDPNSPLTRKNPRAALSTFHCACPAGDRRAALLLRSNGVRPATKGWRRLLALALGDRRIQFHEGTLDRMQAMEILERPDCLVSPQRSERFGRNIAAAISLGVPVIPTVNSGYLDFLSGSERADYKLHRITEGEHPLASDLLWSEPDVAQLARKMQAIRRQRSRQNRSTPGVIRAKILMKDHSFCAAAARANRGGEGKNAGWDQPHHDA